MTKLTAADASFFLTETANTPRHVGGLQIFELPPRAAGKNFCRSLLKELQRFNTAVPPFNQRVRFNRIGIPHWETDEDFDIDRHLFLHELPAGSTRNELYPLVARLHEPVMDRDRPLWEFHIISGLTKRRFAIYTKIHHAYADGITMTSWMVASLANLPDTKLKPPIWDRPTKHRKTKESGEFHLADEVRNLLNQQLSTLKSAKGVAKITSQLLLEKLNLTRNAIALPFMADRSTPLTGHITSDRQVATASVPMERVSRIRKAARASLNHVALSCIDDGLHRYLDDLGYPMNGPITIAMPVSLRKKVGADSKSGNQVGLVLVDLADPTDDPYERLRDIGVKLRYVRYQVDELPAGSILAYSIVIGVSAELLQSFNLGNVVPPLCHTLVSNVPGPRETLYLKDARLAEHYPISTLAPNNRLNITLYSYDQFLHFGLVGTQKLEELKRLGDHIYQAFVDLENAVLNPLNEQREKGSGAAQA